MHIVLQTLGLIYFKSFEIRISHKLMSRQYFESTQWYNLTFLINFMNNNAKSIQLSEIFYFCCIFIPTQENRFRIIWCFQQNLFVLTSKKVINFNSYVHKVSTKEWKFSKLKIFGATSRNHYLQKCFFVGKDEAPLNETPSTIQQFFRTPSTRPQKLNSSKWYSWLSLRTASQRFILSYDDKVLPMRLTNFSSVDIFEIFMQICYLFIQVSEIIVQKQTIFMQPLLVYHLSVNHQQKDTANCLQFQYQKSYNNSQSIISIKLDLFFFKKLQNIQDILITDHPFKLFFNLIWYNIIMDIEYEMGAAPDSRPRTKVSIEASKKYKSLIQQFEKLFQEQQSQFNFSNHSIYYIVSTDFLNSWRDFCLSHEQIRLAPLKMNASLLDPNTKKLKQGLREKEDFEFLSEDVYQLLKDFHGNQLKRTAVKLGQQKRVPIYLNDYQYIPITSADLKKIDQKQLKRQHFSFKLIQQSQNATVNDIIEKIIENQNLAMGHEARLWRIQKKQNLDSLFKYLKIAADKATYQYRIKGFGKRLQNETKIQDLQMEEGDFFVVEIKDKQRRWFLQAESEKKCEGCNDITELKFPCMCEKVAYCSQVCKQKDKRYHLRFCNYAELEELNKPVDMRMTSSSSKGVVGLRNLGNTCFMNSCMQCLSNTEPLTQYFLNSLYEKEINKVNVLGTKGKLAKNYAKFIKGTWCDSDSVFTPDGIKSAVSSINPMFSGYAQHDSQQFFSFLIDGLHEDLNRIEKKPYVQSVESNNRPDSEVAVESWAAHIKRNQSIITDLMTGQYKSKVTCPTCSKQSITFDPFITVTLPIPQKVVNIFEGFFLYNNFEHKTKKISFTYSKPNAEEWCKIIGGIVNVKPESIAIYLVSMSEGIYKAGRESLSEIIYKVQNQSKNIFVMQLSEEELNMKNRIQLTCRFSKKSSYYNEYDNVWFKFPLYFEKQKTTGLTIYTRVLKFLYNQAYNDSKNKRMFGGKSYEQYEEIMLKTRPFQLYLRHGKRLDRFYHRLQHKFDEATQLADADILSQIFKKIQEKDCELDIRFPKSSEHFSFEKLKDFDDISKKHKISRDNDDNEPIQLTHCFQEMSQSEQLQAGNQWYCPNCKEHKQANKEMTIYRAPKILILHLKRFKQKGIIRKEKNETKVNFPTTLNMKPYVINPLPISHYALEPKIKEFVIPPKYEGNFSLSNSVEPIYQLYAISNHYGGLGGGHYTAFGKNGGKWYEFNDSSVRSVSEGSIVGSGAYILFYRRKD